MSKVSDDKLRIAYALGGATCAKVNGDQKRIKLEVVNEDWKDYELTGYGYEGKSNNTYSLYYRGDFGSETTFVRLLMIPEGWELNHAVTLLLSAIQMHKAEMNNKK